jgi:hypothetical protein
MTSFAFVNFAQCVHKASNCPSPWACSSIVAALKDSVVEGRIPWHEIKYKIRLLFSSNI